MQSNANSNSIYQSTASIINIQQPRSTASSPRTMTLVHHFSLANDLMANPQGLEGNQSFDFSNYPSGIVPTLQTAKVRSRNQQVTPIEKLVQIEHALTAVGSGQASLGMKGKQERGRLSKKKEQVSSKDSCLVCFIYL